MMCRCISWGQFCCVEAVGTNHRQKYQHLGSAEFSIGCTYLLEMFVQLTKMTDVVVSCFGSRCRQLVKGDGRCHVTILRIT